MHHYKILHICASHGPILGGMEKQVLRLCEALHQNENLSVALAASDTLTKCASNSIQTHKISSDLSRRNATLKRQVHTLITQVQPDVIHTHGIKAAQIVSALKSSLDTRDEQFAQIRLVATVHGNKKRLPDFEAFDAVIGVSREITCRLRDLGLPGYVIENGIDIEHWQQDHKADAKTQLCSVLGLDENLPLLFAAGRLAKVKNFELLMRACANIPINLIIAGQGPLLSNLEAIRSDNTRLLGEQDDMRSLYQASDAVVTVSSREGMSLTMLEALASGTPVLSSKVSGATEILPPESLLDISSVDALKSSLSDAVTQLAQHQSAQEETFAKVRKNLSTEAMVRKTLDLYKNISDAPDLLFLGDCNTSGTKTLTGLPYPELVSAKLSLRFRNCGQTMSTTREAIEHFAKHQHPSLRAIFIQYGLVDSWQTIKAAPYVLYYPETSLRRFLRRWIKKWKKYGRKLGLGKLFGIQSQVPLDEYVRNIEMIINSTQGQIFLIETPPNLDSSRNPFIQRYNKALVKLAQQHERVHVIECFEEIYAGQADFYLDQTHLNSQAHQMIAKRLLSEPALDALRNG